MNRPAFCLRSCRPAIAAAIERALSGRFHVYAIGEGYSGRPGWRGADANLSEVIVRSSLFVSGAGMATIAEARRAGVPLLVLEGHQPEQALNVARARSTFPADAFACVSTDVIGATALARSIDGALASLRLPSAPRASIAAFDSAAAWRETFGAVFGVPRNELDEKKQTKEVFHHAA
jgi:hypothetical protein